MVFPSPSHFSRLPKVLRQSREQGGQGPHGHARTQQLGARQNVGQAPDETRRNRDHPQRGRGQEIHLAEPIGTQGYGGLTPKVVTV